MGGQSARQPTPWESRPRFTGLGVIRRQLATLVTHPRTLFYSMPTLTGQREAQRWLIGSLVVIFLTALTIVPVLYAILDAEIDSVYFTGSFAMALAWTLFGLMMVGIETAGVATVSRLRGHPGGGVPLAAAAKVTCYSAILMVLWVLLGGAQLIAYVCLSTPHNYIRELVHNSMRGEQIVLAVSLGVAHIGGLIWYELTVYRGIRAVQYANK